ncbi:hypothetical protein GCM10023215_67620 [Pseudonocardia yuanmonensis]|uniref:Uncharacterized protein n=1 Tax=Pseudonocardia yuanmonensis TaxID=1095914 RepID=A0ABP8XTP4_9PSEU
MTTSIDIADVPVPGIPGTGDRVPCDDLPGFLGLVRPHLLSSLAPQE